MNTLSLWWDSLDLALQIFYAIGSLALLAVAVQLVFTMFGGDSGDDILADGDMEPHITGNFFSFRGLTAFAMGFGWIGAISIKWGLHPAVATGIGIVAGVAIEASFLFMMSQLSKLQSDGTFKLENAIGGIGTVYVSIPPKGKGAGEVIIKAGGRSVHSKAFNNTDTAIKSGGEVTIKALYGSGVLVDPIGSDNY